MWWREPKTAVRGCGCIGGPMCSVATQQYIWDVAFRKICAVWPFPLLPRLISPASLRIYIHLPAKGRTILAFHFPVQGFSVFADKCSPIHPDRCHIASLPLWYIASDPATCNRESAPGTPLPGQHSDTGDYFKGASLEAPCAETQAMCPVHKHSLQECGYQLVSGSGSDSAALLVTGHPDTVQYLRRGFMLLCAATPVPHSLLLFSIVTSQVRAAETICVKGRF